MGMKKLAPFALAAACAPAVAGDTGQVKLYGFVDVGVHDSNAGPVRVGTIQRSSLGMRGEESLGGGLAATFHLQQRFEIGTGAREASGAAPAFYGESTVGLRGGFGALRLGRALTPLWAHDWKFDPWGNFNRVASPAWQIFHPSYRSDPHGNGPVGDYSRLDNGIFWDSPAFGGFSVHTSVGVEKNGAPDANGLTDRTRPVGAALNYTRGTFAALLAGERNAARDDTWFAGLSYAIGATTLMGSYNQTHLSAQSQAFLGDADRKRRALTVGATHAVGANTLRVGYGRDSEGYGTAGATDHLGFGVSHALSKRTALYADVGLADPARGARIARWGVGVSHAF